MTRLVDAAQHDEAQALRAAYAPELLALEADLPDDERCYDASLIAARLVASAAETTSTNTAYDASWLGRYYTAALAQARLQPATCGPPTLDDLLSLLGGGAVIGFAAGRALLPMPATVDDLDTALSALTART